MPSGKKNSGKSGKSGSKKSNSDVLEKAKAARQASESVPDEMDLVPEVRKSASKALSGVYANDNGSFDRDRPLRQVETVMGLSYKGPGSSTSSYKPPSYWNKILASPRGCEPNS